MCLTEAGGVSARGETVELVAMASEATCLRSLSRSYCASVEHEITAGLENISCEARRSKCDNVAKF